MDAYRIAMDGLWLISEGTTDPVGPGGVVHLSKSRAEQIRQQRGADALAPVDPPATSQQLAPPERAPNPAPSLPRNPGAPGGALSKQVEALPDGDARDLAKQLGANPRTSTKRARKFLQRAQQERPQDLAEAMAQRGRDAT